MQSSEVTSLYYYAEITVPWNNISGTENFGKVNTATVTVIALRRHFISIDNLRGGEPINLNAMIGASRVSIGLEHLSAYISFAFPSAVRGLFSDCPSEQHVRQPVSSLGS